MQLVRFGAHPVFFSLINPWVDRFEVFFKCINYNIFLFCYLFVLNVKYPSKVLLLKIIFHLLLAQLL